MAYERTKSAVRKAASAILSVGHEALLISADALELAPVMGLGQAARVLLSIWDSVEAVQVRTLGVLVGRC